jgi:DNA-binding transcriptional MerR regulator
MMKGMKGSGEGLWTLDELGARVEGALRGSEARQASGRVREVPDRRTIRYYTTLGLVDRPVLRGRTALYGPRHLLQLVAIKRLQARGLSLQEVQARLLGQTDQALGELAGPVTLEGAEPSEDRRQGAFWRPAPPEAPAPVPILGLRLAEGVTLLVEGSRPGDEDLRALAEAAGPLVELIKRMKEEGRS